MAKKTKTDEKLLSGWHTIHVALQAGLIKKVDAAAIAARRSRANMVATLIEEALAAKEGVSA